MFLAKVNLITGFLFLVVCVSVSGKCDTDSICNTNNNAPIIMGADRLEEIKTIAGDKRIGLIVNQTSVLNCGEHLLDALLKNGLNIEKILAPEHGFRGTEDAGALINNSIDEKTGIPVLSLYGANKKPTKAQLEDVDILLFDIQDVGARFYTYISTMHYAMEAAAENGKEFIVLDRPNPNDFVDGPVRQEGFTSFVGVDPIPVLHGLTVGELARMINGEGWISTGKNSCMLYVVQMHNWRHGDPYVLPVKPSPNLADYKAVRLYPSLCFFEGTNISVGRGTTFPFTVLGGTDRIYGNFSFTPVSLKGFDTNPLYKGEKCYGIDLRDKEFDGGLSLAYLFDFYRKAGKNGDNFFKRGGWFDLISGTDTLRKQIIQGLSEEEIRASWQEDLNSYKNLRKKYLLYDDYR